MTSERNTEARQGQSPMAGQEADPGCGTRGGPDVEAALPAASFPELLRSVQREIATVLGTLREGRRLLRRGTLERLQHTSEKIREVTTVTEVAATDIMDSVEAALALVDELEVPGPPRDRVTLCGSLRDELYRVMTQLQFQDITTQQLQYASSILDGLEQHLATLSGLIGTDLFEAGITGRASNATVHAASPFDPGATTTGASARQALADELLGASSRS